MVYSEEVSKPTSSEGSSSATESLAAAGGGSGMKWSIPFALGPLRLEADKTGDLVPTFDCCFHPLSLQYAHGSKSFREMIVGIAKDAIQTSFEASGDETELADGYTILKGISYKNGSQPKSMMVTKHDTTREQNQSKSPKGDSNTASPQNSNTKNLSPEFKIVERGNFEIADHTTMTTKTISRRPKDLIVYVHLEQVNSVADIALDVSERLLALKSIKHHYNLEVVLPCPVNSNDGHAKFDKRQKQLIVTLPVIEA
jgi:dynein assembly factor 2